MAVAIIVALFASGRGDGVIRHRPVCRRDMRRCLNDTNVDVHVVSQVLVPRNEGISSLILKNYASRAARPAV